MTPQLCALGLVGLVALSAPGASAETIRIEMSKLSFAPARVTAHVGDTVEWVNKDFILHTATARDKSFDVKIPANGTASFTPKQAGEFDYYCRVHPTMTGHLTVSAP